MYTSFNPADCPFQPGDLGFVSYRAPSGRYYIDWGIVDTVFEDGRIVLNRYKYCPPATVNGINLDYKKSLEEQDGRLSEWRRLPKKWTYNTKLLDINVDECSINFTEKSILKYIESGLLLPVEEILCHYKRLEEFIGDADNKGKWKIVHKSSPFYNGDNSWYPYITEQYQNVYKTIAEVKEVIKQKEEELQRVANLSDYDFNKERLEKLFSHMREIYSNLVDEEKIKQVKEFLLDKKDFEDLDFRLSIKGIEYKNYKNKKWMLAGGIM